MLPCLAGKCHAFKLSLGWLNNRRIPRASGRMLTECAKTVGDVPHMYVRLTPRRALLDFERTRPTAPGNRNDEPHVDSTLAMLLTGPLDGAIYGVPPVQGTQTSLRGGGARRAKVSVSAVYEDEYQVSQTSLVMLWNDAQRPDSCPGAAPDGRGKGPRSTSGCSETPVRKPK